jgi:hypothetical protein
MKKGKIRKSLMMCACLLFCGGAILSGQRTAVSRTKNNPLDDVSSKEELPLVIEDFENATTGDKGWAVESDPKPILSKETEKKRKMKNPVPRLEIKIIPGSPAAMGSEEWSLNGMGMKKEKLLGVSFRFRYPGANAVSILPPPEVDWKDRSPKLAMMPATGREEQERGLELPGRVRGISLWVMGQGAPYDLEAWVKDYRGETHVLKFGSVNFVGWRPVTASIPAGMPQADRSSSDSRTAKLTRFVLRAQVNASSEELYETSYFFFDQLKVLANLYRPNFDGVDLEKIFDSGATEERKKHQ